MRIIDAHLHLFAPGPETAAMALAVGHESSTDYLRAYYDAHGIVHGIVMSNHTLHPNFPPLFHYCLGLDGDTAGPALRDAVTENLQRAQCVGIKLYPGYSPYPITDPRYDFVFELAAAYHKPVAVHTGMTAMSRARLRDCHPLTVDDAAARHPDVNFVLCHFGNPFLADAAAVLEKNPNVCADLSGLLEGPFHAAHYYEKQAGYLSMLQSWIAYVDDYSRILFGTDFPAVNIAAYIDFVQHLIPQEHWDAVFFENANRVYNLGL